MEGGRVFNARTKNKTMKWIKTTKEKPSENQVVFAKMPNGNIYIMEYSYIEGIEDPGYAWALVYESPCYENGKWIALAEFDDYYRPVEWMPFPK